MANDTVKINTTFNGGNVCLSDKKELYYSIDSDGVWEKFSPQIQYIFTCLYYHHLTTGLEINFDNLIAREKELIELYRGG